MMKQKILVCLTLVFLLALALGGAALADTMPEVSVVLSENRFNGPAPVDVTVNVVNPLDVAQPGPCALYDPNGARIVEFGAPTLAAGASHAWSGTWQVTEAQLAAGRITFALAYHITGPDGALVQKSEYITVPIVNAGAEARLEISRTITPSTARNGQKVYVTYVITNSGNVEATGVKLQESSAVASSPADLGVIGPGQSKTHTFTVTMKKKTLSSQATLTYSANGETKNVSVEAADIKYADVKLTASLTADKKGGTAGETVKLTLTLKNTGKSDIGGVTVTDPLLGTVFTGLSVEAGKTLTQEKELTITGSENMNLLFSVSGTDASGKAVETATEILPLTYVDPARNISLSVTAEADRSTIYTLPGIVKFTVHVTNTSSVAATGVTVSASGVRVYPYASSGTTTIAPGETLTFVRDVRVDYPGNFRFDAQAAGQLGEALTFQSNLVPVRHAPPTATPKPNPIATPAVPVTEPAPQSDGLPAYFDAAETALRIAFPALLGLCALCAILIAVGVIGRRSSAAKSNQAADSIERSPVPDYTQAVSSRRRHYMPENPEAEDEAADDVDSSAAVTYEPEDLPAPAEPEAPAEEVPSMTDTMTELYPEAAPQEPLTPMPEKEATYSRRRKRADS